MIQGRPFSRQFPRDLGGIQMCGGRGRDLSVAVSQTAPCLSTVIKRSLLGSTWECQGPGVFPEFSGLQTEYDEGKIP